MTRAQWRTCVTYTSFWPQRAHAPTNTMHTHMHTRIHEHKHVSTDARNETPMQLKRADASFHPKKEYLTLACLHGALSGWWPCYLLKLLAPGILPCSLALYLGIRGARGLRGDRGDLGGEGGGRLVAVLRVGGGGERPAGAGEGVLSTALQSGSSMSTRPSLNAGRGGDAGGGKRRVWVMSQM